MEGPGHDEEFGQEAHESRSESGQAGLVSRALVTWQQGHEPNPSQHEWRGK